MSLQGVFQTHRMQDLWINKATVSNHGVFIVGTEGPSPTYIPKEGVSINSFPGDFFFFLSAEHNLQSPEKREPRLGQRKDLHW